MALTLERKVMYNIAGDDNPICLDRASTSASDRAMEAKRAAQLANSGAVFASVDPLVTNAVQDFVTRRVTSLQIV